MHLFYGMSLIFLEAKGSAPLFQGNQDERQTKILHPLAWVRAGIKFIVLRSRITS